MTYKVNPYKDLVCNLSGGAENFGIGMVEGLSKGKFAASRWGVSSGIILGTWKVMSMVKNLTVVLRLQRGLAPNMTGWINAS